MRKRTKRVIALLLAALIGIPGALVDGTYSQASTEASAQQEDIGDFNLSEYRADVYLKDETVCNRNIQFMKESTFPSQVVTDHLDEKHNFQNTVNAWKAAHFATSPSEIAKGGLDEKGYYTAIILSVFKAQSQSKAYIRDAVSDITSDTNTIMSNMKKWVEASDNIELDKIKKNQILTTISTEEQSEIKAFLSKEFKKNHPACANISTLTSDLNAIFDAVSTLGEAVELMSSYIEISEMSGSMKAVLQEMKQQCPDSNQALKAALGEAALAAEDLTGALNATIQNTAQKEAATVLGILLDEGWETIIKTNPYAAAFMSGAEVGTWLGDTVCEILFSTDKTVEQYEKMKCLNEFKALLVSSLAEIGKTYQQNKSTENAENYFAAVDALYSAGNLSCTFTEDYAKILYEDAALGWMVIHEENYNEYMNSVHSIKNCYADEKKSLYGSYLAELEEDYPDIYAIIMGTEDEPVVIPVESVSFRTSETTLEHSDDIFLAYAEVCPANATNKKITYSSSDASVLSVPSNGGFCTIKGNGTVTITATSEDGGHMATQKVIVNNRERTKVLDSGICGGNVKWKLYNNGVLLIYGTGEMRDYEYNSDSSWQEHRKDVTKVVVEDGVTSIGDAAFYGCSSLTSVAIPDSVTSIGEYAFEYCSSLTSVTIPDSVTSIGDCTFLNCSSLTSVAIPDSVTSIGEYPFWGCSSLTSVTIPDSVTSIGNEAFYNCSSLTSVTIPDSVTSIGDAAFRGCSSLTSVTIPDSVTSIGNEAFRGCSSLTSVTIPDSVTSIGNEAFYNCSSLTSVTIPDSVTSIGDAAFYDCSSLTSVAIPNSVTSIGDAAFRGCSSLISVAIPDSVTSIGDAAFRGCSSLTSVAIPNSVSSIGVSAFYNCSSLTSVAIPDRVSSIGVSAFGYCSSLTSVTIPDSVTSIGNDAFYSCSSLTSVVIPDSVTSIGDRTFGYCSSLTSVAIPDSVSFIGDEAFHWCYSLTSVAIPDSVSFIGGGVFSRCDALRDIYYAGSESQWNELIKGKDLHMNVTIHYNSAGIPLPSNTTTSKPGATKRPFETNHPDPTAKPDMPAVSKPSVKPTATAKPKPTDKTNTPNSPLKGTVLKDSKNNVSYKVNAQSRTVAFYKVNNKKAIKAVVPRVVTLKGTEYRVTTISDNAFSGCKKMQSVTIGDFVTKIGNKAFYKCTSLERLTVPANVIKIGKKAFYGCKRLKTIVIESKKLKNKTVGTQAFKGIYKKAVLEVPKKQKKAYKKWLKKKGITKKMKIK